jgi:hypothetical protein
LRQCRIDLENRHQARARARRHAVGRRARRRVVRSGGPGESLCSKMAAEAGKTVVMPMIVTWQVFNALTAPKWQKDLRGHSLSSRPV